MTIRMRFSFTFFTSLMLLSVACVMLGACSEDGRIIVERTPVPTDDKKITANTSGTRLFGEGGLFGGSTKKVETDSSIGSIGVNSFLWRASLDVMSFMPIVSADSSGGVIITDWYATPDAPNERFKVNVFITGQELRTDGLKVTAFRQVWRDDAWRDAPLQESVIRKLEDAVLNKARQLRYGVLSKDANK